MAADILGGRGGQDVRPVVEGAHQPDPHGVVHHQRNPRIMRDLGDRLEIRHVQLGVPDGLDVDGARLRRDGALECLRIAGVHEGRRAAQLGEGVMKELVGPAVEVVGRDDLVPQSRDGQQRQRDGRLARGDRQGARPTFDRRDPLLEDIRRRVHQSRVDIAELLQREQVGRVLRALEDVGRGLVDGHGPRAGRRVRHLSRVQCQRAQSLLCHSSISLFSDRIP